MPESGEHAAAHAGVDLRAVVVDDASTDGTAIAVQQAFPWADVVSGSGALYWNRGMHEGFGRASKKLQTTTFGSMTTRCCCQMPCSGYCISRTAAARRRQARDRRGGNSRRGGRISYGGSVAQSRLKRFSYRPCGATMFRSVARQ